jgi:hypothetical protein
VNSIQTCQDILLNNFIGSDFSTTDDTNDENDKARMTNDELVSELSDSYSCSCPINNDLQSQIGFQKRQSTASLENALPKKHGTREFSANFLTFVTCRYGVGRGNGVGRGLGVGGGRVAVGVAVAVAVAVGVAVAVAVAVAVGVGVGVAPPAPQSDFSTVLVSPFTPSNPQTTSSSLPIAVPPVKECGTFVFGPVVHVSVRVS